MALVSVVLVYNAAAIPLRVAFDVYSQGRLFAWLICDYLFADLIYLLDVAVVQTHVSYRNRLDYEKMIEDAKLTKVMLHVCEVGMRSGGRWAGGLVGGGQVVWWEVGRMRREVGWSEGSKRGERGGWR